MWCQRIAENKSEFSCIHWKQYVLRGLTFPTTTNVLILKSKHACFSCSTRSVYFKIQNSSFNFIHSWNYTPVWYCTSAKKKSPRNKVTILSAWCSQVLFITNYQYQNRKGTEPHLLISLKSFGFLNWTPCTEEQNNFLFNFNPAFMHIQRIGFLQIWKSCYPLFCVKPAFKNKKNTHI